MADAPATPQLVPAVNPDGRLVSISADDVRSGQALADGYQQPTPEQAALWVKQQRYGGVGQQAIAGLEGVGQGLLGPVIPGIEQAAGVPSADIRGRAEINPVTHGTGEAIGFVAPLVATFGASAPVSGTAAAANVAARATVPRLVAGAGALAAKGTTKVLGEGALARIATSGARLATEGAILGASNVATKVVTEDPNLTAEKAAAEIGMSALAGGILGAGGKTLAEVVPSGITEKLQGWLGEVAGNRANKASGAIQSDLNKTLKRMSREDLNALGQRSVENGWVTPLSTPAETFAKTEAAMEGAGTKMGGLLERAAASPEAPTFAWEDIRKTVEDGVLKPLEGKGSTLPAVKQARAVLENFNQVYGGNALTLPEMHGLRRDLDAIIYQHGRALDPFAKAVAEPLKGARDVVAEALEQGIDKAGLASSEWKALNGAYRDAKVINGFAEKGMLRAEGNNLLSLTETMGGLTGVATHGLSGGAVGAVGAAALRRHSAGTIAWAATAAQKALASFAEAGEGRIAAGLGRLFGAGGAKAGAEAAEAVLKPGNYRVVADAVRSHASDPNIVADSVSRQTSELKQHAPEHAAAMEGIAARGIQHLASKLPQEPGPSPFGGTYQPSQADLAAFNRAALIAERPAAILDLISSGKITPDHVQALAAIYPKLHEEMSAQIVDRIAQLTAHKGTVPFATRMGLAQFLGPGVDPLLSPQSMQANQMAITVAARNEETGNVEPGSRSLGNLNLAGRMSTPMQASAQRST